MNSNDQSVESGGGDASFAWTTAGSEGVMQAEIRATKGRHVRMMVLQHRFSEPTTGTALHRTIIAVERSTTATRVEDAHDVGDAAQGEVLGHEVLRGPKRHHGLGLTSPA